MTVLIRAIKNNLEVLEFSKKRTDVSQSSKAIKEIIKVTNMVLLTIGSMALSFYIIFLR